MFKPDFDLFLDLRVSFGQNKIKAKKKLIIEMLSQTFVSVARSLWFSPV